MLRNYLAAALRNLMRDRLYVGINVAGLAAGFAAAILIALFVRDELSYDRFLPDHQRTYLASELFTIPGQSAIWTPTIDASIAGFLKLDFPGIEAVARLCPDQRTLRHGNVEADEKLYWADPNIFDLLRLRAVAGDLRTALQAPDGIVLTRSLARKYFGRDNPIGEVIQIDRRYPMRVRAVLEDLPPNSHLDIQAIASGRGSFSALAKLDKDPNHADTDDLVYTYLRLAPGVSIERLRREIPAFLAHRMPAMTRHYNLSLPLVRVDELHVTAFTEQSMKPTGDWSTIYAVSLVGLLVILVASFNFINLMTARAARRAVEVGIRKAAGAVRRQLVAQFIGETAVYAALSMLIAVGLVEVLLPQLNAFLGRHIGFGYWHDPTVAGTLIAATLLVAALAGTYPALVLSAFAPAAVLKSAAHATPGSGRVRAILVTLQFAVLIGLCISTVVIYRQVHYALNEGLRVDKDQVFVVSIGFASGPGGLRRGACYGAFPDRVRALPGVRAAACAWSGALSLAEESHWSLRLRDGTYVPIDGISVDYGFFELYGLRPLAGRFFSRSHPGDAPAAAAPDLATLLLHPSALPDAASPPEGRIVLNEAGVHRAGFTSPEAAIGKQLFVGGRPLEVIGVVRDFSFSSVAKQIPPIFYVVYSNSFDILNVKLAGHEIPETLAAIRSLWRDTGNTKPMTGFFVDQHMQDVYLDITRRGDVFTGFSGIAVLIACLGLFGLSAFTAERRTKEIGVRKAMGAERSDIVRLLLWQFTKPVLWANLVAWPVVFLAMRHWLRGFAYHIDLSAAAFLAAGAIALLIAWATVVGHALRVAQAKPIAALHYE